jgi:hypothetical protein
MNSELVGYGSGCGILGFYSDTSLAGFRKAQTISGSIIQLLLRYELKPIALLNRKCCPNHTAICSLPNLI